MSVQGRYNPETDRTELKSAGVRRALAARLGQKLTRLRIRTGCFSSPETGKALEAMSLSVSAPITSKRSRPSKRRLSKKPKRTRRPPRLPGARRRSSKKIRGSSPRTYSDASRRPSLAEYAALAKLARRPSQAIVAELAQPADPGRTHRGEALGRGRQERLGERRTQSGSREVVRMKKIRHHHQRTDSFGGGGIRMVDRQPSRPRDDRLGQHESPLAGPERQDRGRWLRRPKVQGVASPHLPGRKREVLKAPSAWRKTRSHASIACRQRSARSASSGSSRTASGSLTSTAALCSRRCRSCASTTASAMCWYTCSYSDRVLAGSPQNSLSTVPIMGFCRHHKRPEGGKD